MSHLFLVGACAAKGRPDLVGCHLLGRKEVLERTTLRRGASIVRSDTKTGLERTTLRAFRRIVRSDTFLPVVGRLTRSAVQTCSLKTGASSANRVSGRSAPRHHHI